MAFVQRGIVKADFKTYKITARVLSQFFGFRDLDFQLENLDQVNAVVDYINKSDTRPIQQVLHFLDDDQREFLISGILPGQFPDGDEED